MYRSAWVRNGVILMIMMVAVFLALGCSTRPKEPEEVYALRESGRRPPRAGQRPDGRPPLRRRSGRLW